MVAKGASVEEVKREIDAASGGLAIKVLYPASGEEELERIHISSIC